MRSVERLLLAHMQVQLVSVKASPVALAAWWAAVGLSALKKFCSPVGASVVAGEVNANSTTAVACLQENFAALGLVVIVRV